MNTRESRPRLRNPIACEYCKLKKARCNPSEVEGKCQNCLKSGRTCIPAARNPRPRKPKVSKTSGRVAELERKIDRLLGSVDGIGRNAPIRSDKESFCQAETTAAVEEDRTEVLLDIHSQIFPGGNRPEESLDEDETEPSQPSRPRMNTSIATPNSSVGNSNFSQISVISFPDSKECEKLLSFFLEISSYFPFIIIPENTDLNLLLEENHLLSLAMMTAASSSNAKLQTILDTQFRQALSTKVIMGGQKSLEIVQGLLIYLAWYPYHLKPRNAQTFQFLQILISMCNDLGIDQSTEDFEVPADIRRAYLGCYYLSISFSTLFKKPNNIEYNTYTQSCCNSFTTNPEYPTDPLLPHLIDLAHSSASFAKSPLTTPIPLESFKSFLQTYTPSNPKTTELITLTQDFTSLFHHSILGPGGLTRLPTNLIPLSMRNVNLLPCLHSCITFLDTILSLPIKSYLSFTIIQWSQLVYTIATLMVMSFPIKGLKEWDGEVARKEGRLGVYLESLCYRMTVLGGGRKGKVGGFNQYGLMGVVLEYVRGAYDKRVEGIHLSSETNMGSSLSDPDGLPEGAAKPTTTTSTAIPKGPTSCPMLNGGIRSFATESSPAEPFPTPHSGDTTGLDFQNTNNQDFGFELGEWGSSIDDFSLYDNETGFNMDWVMGDQGGPETS